MKTTKYTIAFATLFLGLASCNNEEVSTSDNLGQVNLSAGIATTIVTDATTRLAADPKVSAFTNRTFRLLVKDNRTTSNLFTDIEQVVTTASTTGSEIEVDGVTVKPAQVPLNPLLYWNDLGGINADLKFIGIYPSTVTAIATTFIAATNQSVGSDASDLMLAYRPTYTYSTDRTVAANLPFKHMMAKVTLNIKGGETGQVDLKDITSVVLTGCFKNEVTIDWNTVTTAGVPSATAVNITPYKETTPAPTATNVTYTAIVAPTAAGEKIAAGTQVATITAKGNEYKVSVTNECTLAAGKNNIFNITLTKSDIAATATITNWEDNVIPSGTSQLIEVAPALVNEDGVTNENKVTVDSKLLVTIQDKNNKKHTVTYAATNVDGVLRWIADKMLYWDDIAFNASGDTGVTADAILKLDGSGDPDKLFVATQLTNIQKYATNGTLKFAMKHALSKVVVTIQTTDDSSPDKVLLTEIQKVELPNYYNYTVNAAAPFITKAANSGDINITDKKDPDSYVYTTYIYPQTVAVSNGTSKASLIDVTVGTSPVNVYQLTTVLVNNTPLAEINFEANKVYNITMTLKKSNIAATAKVTIAPWELGSTITGDGGITQ